MKGSEFSFFDAAVEDLEDLAHLEAQGFEPPWTREALAAELQRQEDLFLLARASKEASLAGYAAWRICAHEAELLRVAVAPELRRRGLARNLLRTGLGRLREASARVCFLEVRPDNRGARNLYRALGFREVGERPGYYPDGSRALIYSLELNP